jgi:ADP-heptose:LPS heptosyltransferase
MKGLEWVLTDAIPPQFEHEAERRSRIIECIGAAPISTAPKVFLSDAERQAQRLPAGRWAALHPGAKEPFRRWPVEHFIKVGRALQEKGMQILITGSASERALMEAVAQGLPGATLLDPKSSIRKLAALLEQMDLIVSNDTGPLHLAAALDRPVIGLYGPTDPRLCGPYRAERATIISRKPTCTPCLRKKCNSPFCLLQIGPEETIKALCLSD